MTIVVPFFVGSAGHLATTPNEGRFKMSDIVLPELANAVYADRVRDAKRPRLFSVTKRNSAPASVLKSLLFFFART